MRTFGALVIASGFSALMLEALLHLFDIAFLDRSLPTLARLFEVWAVMAFGILFINALIGLPVISLLAHFRILRGPIVIAAGAAVGLAFCAMVLLLPNSDPPATPTLMQQLAPWLKFGIAGMLSAAVLAYVLRPGSKNMVGGNAHKGGARHSP